jgi:hypothetical protein
VPPLPLARLHGATHNACFMPQMENDDFVTILAKEMTVVLKTDKNENRRCCVEGTQAGLKMIRNAFKTFQV